MNIKNLLLSIIMTLSLTATAQNRNFGRNREYVEPNYPIRDSVEQNGYNLVYNSNDATFSPEVKKTLVSAFFEVYPPMVERFNKDAAKRVVFVVDTGYHGVAATSGRRVVFNPQWFIKNPKDIDVVTHEVMHIIQNYGRSRVPGWVTEGIADYARYKYGLYNKEANWSLTELRPDHGYTSSYRVTARFFVWLEEREDPQIVDKLDAAARQDKFDDDIWERLTGRTIDQLWADYVSMPAILKSAKVL
jgi:hypothetical protein